MSKRSGSQEATLLSCLGSGLPTSLVSSVLRKWGVARPVLKYSVGTLLPHACPVGMFLAQSPVLRLILVDT